MGQQRQEHGACSRNSKAGVVEPGGRGGKREAGAEKEWGRPHGVLRRKRRIKDDLGLEQKTH